jgi:hypothetical protein
MWVVLLECSIDATHRLPRQCCRVAVLPCCHLRFKPFAVGNFVFIFCYKTFKLQVATWQLATRQHLMGYMIYICIILYIIEMATKMATNKRSMKS